METTAKKALSSLRFILAIVGILVAAWLTFELLTLLLWTCYYAGIQM